MITRALEDWEIEKVFAAVKGWHARRNETLLIVGIALGLRANELIHLTVGDVTTDGVTVKRHIEIRGETAKFGKARSIRIGEGVRRTIADFLRFKKQIGQTLISDRPLFVSQKGRFLTREGLFLLVKKIFREVDINQSPHSLRKTGGTIYYIESNYDLIATQHFLGHADPSTTRRYIGLTSEQLAEYAERASSHLLGAIYWGREAKLNTSYKMEGIRDMVFENQRCGGFEIEDVHHADTFRLR